MEQWFHPYHGALKTSECLTSKAVRAPWPYVLFSDNLPTTTSHTQPETQSEPH